MYRRSFLTTSLAAMGAFTVLRPTFAEGGADLHLASARAGKNKVIVFPEPGAGVAINPTTLTICVKVGAYGAHGAYTRFQSVQVTGTGMNILTNNENITGTVAVKNKIRPFTLNMGWDEGVAAYMITFKGGQVLQGQSQAIVPGQDMARLLAVMSHPFLRPGGESGGSVAFESGPKFKLSAEISAPAGYKV